MTGESSEVAYAGRRTLDAARAGLREEYGGVIARAVQDVNDVDPFGRLTDHTIKNLIAAVCPVPYPAILVTRHEWESERHIGKAQAFVSQFPHKTHGTTRIICCYVVADGFDFGFSSRQNTNDHRLPFASA